MADFLPAFEEVVLNEGGYKLTDIKQDRGGQTYAGISRKFHPHWPGWSYIDRGQAPQSLFDFGVNAGWRVSAKLARYRDIVTRDRTQGRFLLGWINRLLKESV